MLRGLPREVGVLALMAFFVALGFGIVAPVIPVFARSFDVSATEASAVVSVFALVRLISGPISGGLVDRLGERLVLAVGLLIVAASSAAAGLSQDFGQLLVLRGAGGLGSSMFSVAAMALVIRVVDASERGRAVGAYQSGFLFGGLAGPAIGGFVVAWSLRAPFFVYAGSLVLAFIVTVAMLSRTKLHERESEVAPQEVGKVEHLRQALRERAYVAALTINLITGSLYYGMRSSTVPLFVTDGMGQSATFISVGFLIAAVVQAVLMLPAGRLADTSGRRRAMLIGSVATTIGMVLLTLTDVAMVGWHAADAIAIGLLFASMAIQGIGAAFLGSAPAAVVGDVAGGRRGGIVVAAFQMAADFGGVIGPIAAGLLVDAWDFDAAFGASSALGLLAVMVVWFMPETLQRRHAARGSDREEPEPR